MPVAEKFDGERNALLRRTRREKGADHEETLGHLAALAAHLERMGKTDEARSLREEHDRIAARKSQ